MSSLNKSISNVPEKEKIVKQIDLDLHNNDEILQDTQIEVETTELDLDQAEENVEENKDQEETQALSDYQLARDRVKRTRFPSSRINNEDFVTYFSDLDIISTKPNSYEEVMNGKNSKLWLAAIQDEMNSLMKNRTWTLVSKPKDQKVIDWKWVYKVKE
ncbi:Retrovirus-related Pol polyprotein from transposon TNT 1-94 [Abeliophyllum distichum]|uniref:Retrovirus-related Pol polyprotein from transposon TNT 1-94 n=1 Tax=Abeliophyllum distichum TaxID=126358 RepID=A0ABD1SC72_9LAMI